MNGIRNVALIGLGLVISMVVTHFGIELAALIFLPLFFLWFTLWDDKKARQAARRYHQSDNYHQQIN